MNREVRKVVTMQRYLMELKYIRKWVKSCVEGNTTQKCVYAEDVEQEQCYNYRLFEAWDNQALPFCTMSLVSGRNTRNWPNLIFSIIHPQEINTKSSGDEWVINCKAIFSLSNTFELSRLFQDCIDNFQSNFFPDWTTTASSFCFQDLSKLSVNCLSSADEQWGCAYAYEEDKDYAHDDEDYASEEDVNDDDLINDEEDDDGSRTIVHHVSQSHLDDFRKLSGWSKRHCTLLFNKQRIQKNQEDT